MDFSRDGFEVCAWLQSHGASSYRELSHKLGLDAHSISNACQYLLDRGLIQRQGTLLCATKIARDVLEPFRVSRAIILAAGLGTRLLPETKKTPKPMLKLNGRRLIDTQIDACIEAGITDITIVRGHLGHRFDELLNDYPSLRFVDNPRYTDTNNIYSLLLALNPQRNTYVIEGDLFIKNPTIIRGYEQDTNYCGYPVDSTSDWSFVLADGHIRSVQYGNDGPCYQYVGISYWTQPDISNLRKHITETLQQPNGYDLFYEQVPLNLYKHHYRVALRNIQPNDSFEIDHYHEFVRQDTPKSS